MLFCPLMKLLAPVRHRDDCSGCADKIHRALVVVAQPPQQKGHDAIAERMRQAKERFLFQFERQLAVISTACLAAGISRESYYAWRRNDPDFVAEVERIKAQLDDYVEDQLINAVHEKKLPAILFYLDRKHPKYTKKVINTNITEKTLEDLIDADRAGSSGQTITYGVVA